MAPGQPSGAGAATRLRAPGVGAHLVYEATRGRRPRRLAGVGRRGECRRGTGERRGGRPQGGQGLAPAWAAEAGARRQGEGGDGRGARPFAGGSTSRGRARTKRDRGAVVVATTMSGERGREGRGGRGAHGEGTRWPGDGVKKTAANDDEGDGVSDVVLGRPTIEGSGWLRCTDGVQEGAVGATQRWDWPLPGGGRRRERRGVVWGDGVGAGAWPNSDPESGGQRSGEWGMRRISGQGVVRVREAWGYVGRGLGWPGVSLVEWPAGPRGLLGEGGFLFSPFFTCLLLFF